MRKFSIIALLLICIFGASYIVYKDFHSAAATGISQQPTGPGAQGGGGGRRGGRMLARLTQELSLTPDQVAKIKPILKDERSQMGAVRNDASLTDDQARTKMQAIRATANSQIDPILTPIQLAKWKTIQAQQRQGGRSIGAKAAN